LEDVVNEAKDSMYDIQFNDGTAWHDSSWSPRTYPSLDDACESMRDAYRLDHIPRRLLQQGIILYTYGPAEERGPDTVTDTSGADCAHGECDACQVARGEDPVNYAAPAPSVLAEATLAAAVKVDPPRTALNFGQGPVYAGNATCFVDTPIARQLASDPGKPCTAKLPTPAADADRKAIPVWTGCVRYFPSALLEVAKVSKAGNDQHNPGQPLHWAQGKSMNQTDTAMRHLLDADATEGTAEELAHLAQAAWRVLARLQLACQREGAPLAPGARSPETKP
jgi:hypothetical protein